MKAANCATESSPGICGLTPLNVDAEPFPHVIRERFIAPPHYEQLRSSFPTCPPSTGPTGFSLYWGDDEYQRLLDEHESWRALFDTFHSQRFIDWAVNQFAGVWQQEGCLIDLSRARYVPYREDRIDKERATLRRVEHAPEELWVRMDVHQGRVGYYRRPHLDHARRLISMLVYFCDRAENRMVGGELFLHPAQQSQANPDSLERITPQHNLMVAFPCMQRSLHSVSKITSAGIPRNYIQVHISSSVAIWEREEVFPTLRQRLGSLAQSIPVVRNLRH